MKASNGGDSLMGSLWAPCEERWEFCAGTSSQVFLPTSSQVLLAAAEAKGLGNLSTVWSSQRYCEDIFLGHELEKRQRAVQLWTEAQLKCC